MNEIVKMFQDQGSVDELGIGPIRDAFSNSFFPGTSVLHTRVRYLLFVPWLVAESTRRGHPQEQAGRDLRNQEVRLIKALLAGGEDAGVIGNRAQERLKTMPSQVYWPALQRFGLLRWELSINGHLRRAGANAKRGTDVTAADAADAVGLDLGLDPELPPAPPDLLSTASFALRAEEAAYLQGVFARLPERTLLHWMARQPETVTGERIWSSPAIASLPDVLRHQVDHARRLHHAWHGAPLLYNLMLAEIVRDDELIELYRAELDVWQDELGHQGVFERWSQPDFWSLVRGLNPRLRVPTQTFVSTWFALAQSGGHDSERARDLVRQREILLKGRRSRLLDPRARETWSPGAGTARLGYRWSIVTSFFDDIQAGLELADDSDYTEGVA
ncbi:hypothetical protein KV100_03095 [Mumia sp. zg.B21]|nr:hypothetical protein [Mumia sp. zg.B21]